MKKIMLVFGTRPEAIKMCPLVWALKHRENVQTVVCVTGQHREMLDSVLSLFDVVPDHDLEIMRDGQTLSQITSAVLLGMERILELEKPDLVLVHGDTTTAFAAGLAAFYQKIPVGHVEAGLRTGDMMSPFPEEFNRFSVSAFASFHFAPTQTAKENLLAEGKHEQSIFVTGNTAIDAMQFTVKNDYMHPVLQEAAGRRVILMTAHRRENLGEGLSHIFAAVKTLAEKHPEIFIIYPVHPNPLVKNAAQEMLAGLENVRLIPPLSAVDFHNFMARSYLVLTDSGGAQEEAPFFGVPVLVMRDTTERPEGIEAGTAKLVGTKEDEIFAACEELLENPASYVKMARAANPYGDGHAAEKICEALHDIDFY